MLDSAPDAFVTLDRDGRITTWNAAAERLFGWPQQEAIGKTMRDLIFPAEDREATTCAAGRARPRVAAHGALRGRARAARGRRFPGEATVSRSTAGGEVFVSGFITDVTERLRRQAEREALLREQAARAEAERVAEMVGGMQALVDAALAHRTPRRHPSDLVSQVRGVLEADAATIYLADDDDCADAWALDRRRRPRSARALPAAWRKRARRCSPRRTTR